MRRAHALLGVSTAMLFAAAAFMLLPKTTQASPTEAVFLVPAHDGYGAAECLLSDHSCGKVVANSWCEAQGYVKAVSFHQIAPEDATGTIEPVSVGRSAPPVAITCVN